MYLEKINGSDDIKKLDDHLLPALADEARTALLNKISHHGGHNGPNLGMVEMTVALHRVFNSPTDKIVFDISHQTYIHKMLTGRSEAFLDPVHYDDVSGYTNPKESDHDLFTIGHTSTSLSLANGLAVARDLKKEKYNVVAVIGDGSLSGGLAFEGLNNIAVQNSNIIVIVNDNDQSIAKNAGGLYDHLQKLRSQDGKSENNLFEAIGFEYHYLENGNDVLALTDLFSSVKDTDHPVLLHIHTIKGKGFRFAEENREKFHAGGPFSLETGEYLYKEDPSEETYDGITTGFLLEKMKNDPTVIAVNAGTPMMLFTPEQREQLGRQFIDVGIAEQHAATMTAGLAKNGAKPVWAVYSTFMQRSYDQISHDLALNNLPGTILVYAASAYGMTDESHLGIFDIPFMSHIPNIVYLAPTSKEEYVAMLDWSLTQTKHPVAIRIPVGKVMTTGKKDETDYSILYKSKVARKGSRVALIAVGNMYSEAEKTARILKERAQIDATLINPVYISDTDKDLLLSLEKDHELVVTLEDGITDGGYGQMVAGLLASTSLKVKNFGLEKNFHDRFNPEDLMRESGMTAEQIASYVQDTLI